MSKQPKKSSATSSAKNDSKFIEIIAHIRKTSSLKGLLEQFNLSKQSSLDYYTKPLKVNGVIEKIGYSVWEVNEQKAKDFLDEISQNNFEKLSAVANNHSIRSSSKFKKKKVRGHGFQIKFRVPPTLKNWDKRHEYLHKNKIEHKEVGPNWEGYSITVNGVITWLTTKHIVFYAPKWLSWFAVSGKHSRSHAIYDITQELHRVERRLGLETGDFQINKKYDFTVSRQHYGIVQSSLAKQYDKEGKKLRCYETRGFWMEIDNSHNLHEIDYLHPKTAHIDVDHQLQFFNSLDRQKTPVTIDDIFGVINGLAKNQKQQLGMIGDVTANQVTFDRNMQSHIKAVQDLGKGVNELRKAVQGQHYPLGTEIPEHLKIYSKAAYKRLFGD